MDPERDLRNVLLLLIRSQKMFQANGLAWKTALDRLSLEQKNSPEVQQGLLHGLEEGTKEADAQAARLEAALAGEEPFLELLRVYASRQFWK